MATTKTEVDRSGAVMRSAIATMSGITAINAVVSEIAVAAQQQASSLAEVSTAVNQMDQVTQQNSALVEETTASTHALLQQAEHLDRLIAHFKVGTRRAEPVVALKAVGRSGAAPKPGLATKTWRDF